MPYGNCVPWFLHCWRALYAQARPSTLHSKHRLTRRRIFWSYCKQFSMPIMTTGYSPNPGKQPQRRTQPPTSRSLTASPMAPSTMYQQTKSSTIVSYRLFMKMDILQRPRATHRSNFPFQFALPPHESKHITSSTIPLSSIR